MNNNRSIFPFIFIMFMILSSGIDFGFILPMIVIFFVFNIFKQKGKTRQGNRERRDFERGRRQTRRQAQRPERQTRPTTRRAPTPTRKRNNPFKKSGVEKFKDYEYDAAIEDFKKALEIDATDATVHFNIACAYSLTEEKEKALFHLDRAVGNGFKDFDKIRSHEALAYIRIQDEYQAFAKNNFRLAAGSNVKNEDLLTTSPNLLDQLNKLGELRDKGVLSEEEFLREKEKILRP